MPSFAELQAWCSEERLAAYLEEADGSEDLAVRLYEWNADLCGAFTEVLHHVEVIFRQRLHRELSHSFVPGPWYDEEGLLEERGQADVAEAKRRIGQRGEDVTPGRVVAALPFGFWNALFGHGYETLWRQSLHLCFRPHGPRLRKDVVTITERIRLFRNRVAHHERLFHQNLLARHDDLIKLAMWIDPEIRDWVIQESRVRAVIDARPA
jgi:hypothetical protein